MIYLDYGATSFHKPPAVYRAVERAMRTCASPGRGGYGAAQRGAEVVFSCRETAGKLFDCRPEQVVLTTNCTHGLNIAIRSLVKPGGRVAVSGFEHNAVMRPLYALGAEVQVAGRHLFDWDNTLEEFRRALRDGADAAVFTHVSNVFGYILPVEEMAALCREQGVPFILDAAQSAGILPVKLNALGAEFIAVPATRGCWVPRARGCCCAGGRLPRCCSAARAANPFGKICRICCRSGWRRGRSTCPGQQGWMQECAMCSVRAAGLGRGGTPPDPAVRPDAGKAGGAGFLWSAPGGNNFLCPRGGLRGICPAPGRPGNCRPRRAALCAPGARKRRDAGNRNRPRQLRPRCRRLADGRTDKRDGEYVEADCRGG